MEKGLTAKHKQFIQLVASGDTITAAYLATSNNKQLTNGTARANGSKLAKKYEKEIEKAKEKYVGSITNAKEREVVENALKSILSQAEVDAKLCSIISGEFEIEESAFFDGVRVKSTRSPNANEVVKAIDVYNKRFGANAAQKVELSGTIGEAPVTSLKIRKRSEK